LPYSKKFGKRQRSMSIVFYKWKFQANNLEWYFRRQVKFRMGDIFLNLRFELVWRRQLAMAHLEWIL
jgi:hypothetical protein